MQMLRVLRSVFFSKEKVIHISHQEWQKRFLHNLFRNEPRIYAGEESEKDSQTAEE